MKIEFWMTGKTAFPYLDEGIGIYLKRLKHYNSFSPRIFPDIKKAKNYSKAELKNLECKQILKNLHQGDFLILLDENGKHYDSVGFSKFLENQLMLSHKRIIFLIGGAYGFSEEIYKRSNSKIALSKMTFSHQMVRLLFIEQHYRAFTIIRNEPYHHR